MSKRKLTHDEMEELFQSLSDYISIPFVEIRENVKQKIIDMWKPSLESIMIYESQIPNLFRTLRHDLLQSFVQPGECVGITCAQSIGERQTQLTLNSFHSAGSLTQTVVTGVPRFLELLNATKEPKLASCSFYLHPDIQTILCHISEIRQFVQYQFVYRCMKDMVDRFVFFYEIEEEIWYTPFEQLYGSDFRNYEIGIKMFLKPMEMWKLRMPLFFVKERIEQMFPETCVVFSPQHFSQIDIFVDISDLLLPEGCTGGETEQYYLQLFLENVVLPKLMDLSLCGMKPIEDIYIQRDSKKNKEYKLETLGSSFQYILGHPDVDMSRVTCNHMWEVFQCLGIEATRQFLLEEFDRVVSSDGTFLHPSHIQLLVDFMTFHGTIGSISRYGMKRETNGPLSKASFEEVMDHFLTASFVADTEEVESISASIICGKRSKMGTGLCSLRMDTHKIAKLSPLDHQSFLTK